MERIRFLLGLSLLMALGFSSCGVKGPPLPPVADTPDASERDERSAARVAPAPSPSPTPAKSGRKKR